MSVSPARGFLRIRTWNWEGLGFGLGVAGVKVKALDTTLQTRVGVRAGLSATATM